MNELKPCPFCGGKAINCTKQYNGSIYRYRIQCDNAGCACRTPWLCYQEDAADVWNRRAEMADILKNQWISVKDKLPKFNQRVLVIAKNRLYKNSPIRLGSLCISIDGEETWWEIDDGEVYENNDIVTHWMHLPEFPKEN